MSNLKVKFKYSLTDGEGEAQTQGISLTEGQSETRIQDVSLIESERLNT
jgi:hypothetical protein